MLFSIASISLDERLSLTGTNAMESSQNRIFILKIAISTDDTQKNWPNKPTANP
jgi:hypothetical protein